MLRCDLRRASSYCVSQALRMHFNKHGNLSRWRKMNTYRKDFGHIHDGESGSSTVNSRTSGCQNEMSVPKQNQLLQMEEHFNQSQLKQDHNSRGSIKQNVKSKRQWRFTEEGKQYNRRSNSGFDFTVMSYNVLSQEALERHSYLYRHCKPKYLEEEYRMSNIINEIHESCCDVICLQEVEEDVFEGTFMPFLDANGFQGIYKQRTGGKTDGCCIFWRKSKFELHEYQAVEFKVEKLKLLNRDNVGLIVALRPCHRGAFDAKIHFATTHLLFNPRRGDIKLCQLRLLFAELDKMAFIKTKNNIRHYHPIILCGDFNTEPKSLLYKFIELCSIPLTLTMSGDISGQVVAIGKGNPVSAEDLSLECINICQESRYITKHHKRQQSLKSQAVSHIDSQSENNFYHSLNFISAQLHSTSNDNLGQKPLTSMTGKEFGTVDHIFYNRKRIHRCNLPDFCQDRLHLLGSIDLLYKKDFKDIGGLPNIYLSSDHIYIMSKFLILPK